jgi:hypothetical protein
LLSGPDYSGLFILEIKIHLILLYVMTNIELTHTWIKQTIARELNKVFLKKENMKLDSVIYYRRFSNPDEIHLSVHDSNSTKEPSFHATLSESVRDIVAKLPEESALQFIAKLEIIMPRGYEARTVKLVESIYYELMKSVNHEKSTRDWWSKTPSF